MNSASMNKLLINYSQKMAELSDSEEWTDDEVLYHGSDSEFDAKSDEEHETSTRSHGCERGPGRGCGGSMGRMASMFF